MAKQPTKENFDNALARLSNALAIDALELSRPLEPGYPRQDITEMLLAVLRSIKQKMTDKLANDLQRRNTRKLITALRIMSPQTVQQRSPADQLDTIQSLLELWGCKDARRFPLFAHESQEPLINGHSVELLSMSDRWLTRSYELLEEHSKTTKEIGDKARLGMLCLFLTLHAGVCSRAELQRALFQLYEHRVRRKGDLFWLSGYVEHRNMERFRTWICENTVLLATSINWEKSGLLSERPGKAITLSLRALAACDRSAFAGLNTKELLGAGVARGFFIAKLPTFLLSHMLGETKSSALPESVIARLMNCDQCALDMHESPSSTTESARKYEPASTNENEAAPSPVARDNIITELSYKLNTSAAGAKTSLRFIIKQALESDSLPGLIVQLLKFCLWRLETASPRTTKTDLDALTAKLLAAIPENEAIADPEYWAELVEQMTQGLESTSKSLSAISSFARFLSEEYGETFPSAGSSASYRVNAQVLTAAEVESASSLLIQDLGQELGHLAGLILKVTFGTGLRRSEVDGLLVHNIQMPITAAITVRANDYRGVKSRNAPRNIALGYAECYFNGVLKDLAELIDQHPNSPDALIFEAYGHQPLSDPHRIFNAIAKALQQVTGDPKVKTHSLRHSFCCYLLLSLYFDQLGLARFEEEIPYLKEINAIRDTTEALLRPSGAANQFELATVRGLLGHLSENTTLGHYFHFCDLLRFAGFSNEQARMTLSNHGIVGALGKNQNTKSVAKQMHDLTALKEAALTKVCTTLPKRTQRKSIVIASQIQETKDLREDLFKVMAVAKSVSNDEVQLAQDTITTTLGSVPPSQIEAGISWFESVFPPGFVRKNINNPFAPITKTSAKNCLQIMLNNIKDYSAAELKELAGQLRASVLQHRGNTYLNYQFDDRDELLAAGGCLQRLLTGFPACYEVTTLNEKKSTVLIYDSLHKVPKLKNRKYKVHMQCVDGASFPHRPLIWLTLALTLATGA